MLVDYEIIIVGGGPAALTWEVENYPGVEKISGYDLGQIMERQARSFGLEIRSLEVTGVASSGGVHRLSTTEGELSCRALIIASGSRYNHLGAPGESELMGRGVSYCATCDGAFYQGVPVAVVGGGDTALEEAMFLTRYASRVFLVHRRSEFRGTKLLQERIAAEPKIEPVLDAVVERIEGKDGVTGLEVKNLKSGVVSHIAVEGAFIFVGTTPNTEFLRGFLTLDAKGFIETTQNLETTIPGVFAAGDVRAKVLRQISTAVGEGALAATMADHYMSH
jgi:thioredoxin reductase (NADPH)